MQHSRRFRNVLLPELSLRGYRQFLFLIAFFGYTTRLQSDDSEEVDFFESKIRPVLVAQCYKCHSANAEIKGGLSLDSRDSARKGGDSGAAVVPGQVTKSLLISALKYESLEMPPSGKLDDRTIANFVKWIEMGAPDPREPTPASHPATERVKKQIDWSQATSFWSFQKPERHAPPNTSFPNWPQTSIDAFVLRKLEDTGLLPNDPATRATWLRRVSIDLTGLPPSAQEIQEFHDDSHPEAFRNAVERLLASPHFGERWARLWLDIARYAEDQAHIVGDDKSLFYPNAYLYRDWVIHAFNSDLRYDEFIRLQLAADLIAPSDETHQVALGFIGLGPKYYRRNAPDVMAEEWEDRVDTLTRGMLGLTVACARCHDHKYDPIPTEDYYAVAGVFAGVEMFNKPISSSIETKERGQAKNPDQSIHVVRDSNPRDLKVMIRGDVTNEGELVSRGFIRALTGGEKQQFTQGSGRAELAEAVASRHNPLTARVIVNRVWGEIFGQPLVSTPSNFGSLGSQPTHPELLDDLAVRFMDAGWSLKWLMREIVLSATYQQSSQRVESKSEMDPANRLLWRANRKRLSIEAWRDSLLLASGSLNRSIGGKSIVPSKSDESRRTVYSTVSRFQLDPILSLFDFPDPNTHAERRSLTTTPLQKLFFLNSPFMIQRANRLAQRAIELTNTELPERIAILYEAALARRPDAEELRLATLYLQAGNETPYQWEQFAQVLLSTNELLVVD